MMKKLIAVVFSAASLVGLSGCAGLGPTATTVGGAAVGGLLGSSVGGTSGAVLGAGAGAYVGHEASKR